MTIRIRPALAMMEEKSLAAHLTPALLVSLRDEAPDGNHKAKPGTAWLRWSNASPARESVVRTLD